MGDAGVVTFTDVIDATTDELISQPVSGRRGRTRIWTATSSSSATWSCRRSR